MDARAHQTGRTTKRAAVQRVPRWSAVFCFLFVLALCPPPGRSQSAQASAGEGAGPRHVRVVVLLDLTDSINRYDVTRPTAGEVRQLVAAVRGRGGEVAFGAIEADARAAPVRVALSPPPPVPRCPATSGSVFAQASEKAACERTQARYRDVLVQHTAQQEPDVLRFLSGATDLLQRRADARRTDLWHSLQRAQAILLEPGIDERSPPERWLCILSDGRHNAPAASFVPLAPSIRVLVVTGAPDMGVLDRLQPAPLRFESGVQALRYLAHQIAR